MKDTQYLVVRAIYACLGQKYIALGAQIAPWQGERVKRNLLPVRYLPVRSLAASLTFSPACLALAAAWSL